MSKVQALEAALRKTTGALEAVAALINGECPSLWEDDHHYDLATDGIESGNDALALPADPTVAQLQTRLANCHLLLSEAVSVIAIDDHPDIVDNINSELGADTDDGCGLPVCQELTRLLALSALTVDKDEVRLLIKGLVQLEGGQADIHAVLDLQEKCRAHAAALKEGE